MSALEQQPAESAPVDQCLSFTGVPKPDAVFYMGSNECQGKGNHLSPPAASCAPVITPNNAVGGLCCLAGSCWVCCLPGPPCPFPQTRSSACILAEFFLDRCGILHLSLLNFTRFLLCHSFGLSRSLWKAALPHSTSIAPSPTLHPQCHLQISWVHCIAFSSHW